MAKIVTVLENSVGEELGIKSGDELIGVNNLPLQDVLQYYYFDKQRKMTLNVKTKEGTYVFYKVGKDAFEILGLEFDESLDIKPVECKNQCVYDFNLQLPRKIRKNCEENCDDWRLSVLQNKYVCLYSLTKKDLKRILKEKPSPLHIDFPAFDAKISARLLGFAKPKKIYKYLKIFAKHKIIMHAQIVLCPPVNGGEILKQTIKKLSKLFPYINSVSVVPIVLTDYSTENNFVEPVTRTDANKCLEIINKFNISFYQKNNSNFVFASDEIYQKAKRVIPNANYYGEFCQLHNGVGVIAKMRKEVNDYLKVVKISTNIDRKVNIVVGENYFDFMNEIAERINKRFRKIKVKVFKIINTSLGRNIISNKLICGQDVILQLSNKTMVGDVIILKDMLCVGDNIFIDDVNINQISKDLNLKIKIIDLHGYELIRAILQEEKKWKNR